VAAQCQPSDQHKVIFLVIRQASPPIAQCVVFSPQQINRGPSPHFGMTLETTFSPLSFDKSFMKISSAILENGCLVFLWRTEKNKYNKKKQKKNICKTYASASSAVA